MAKIPPGTPAIDVLASLHACVKEFLEIHIEYHTVLDARIEFLQKDLKALRDEIAQNNSDLTP